MLFERLPICFSSILRRRLTSCALEYQKHGDPVKVISLIKQNLDEIKPGFVLTKTLASPVNPADINQIQGVYAIKPPLPAIGGNEGLVEIVDVGPGVSGWKPGDWALPSGIGQGLWCSHSIWPVASLMPVSNKLSIEAAAMIKVNPCTAYRMLVDFVELNSSSDDVVLQNAANSGVGQNVIQIASAMNLKSINIIRDSNPNVPGTKKFLTDLGADFVLTESEFKAEARKLPKPKLALNAVGGRSTLYMTMALAPGGKLVTYGGMSRQPLQAPTGPFIFNDISLHGFWVSAWYEKHGTQSTSRQDMLNFITDLYISGKLKPPQFEHVNFKSGWQKAMEVAVSGTGPKQLFVFDE